MAATDSEVKSYWDRKSVEMKGDPKATIKDHEFREMEVEIIKGLLKPSYRVFDVGCGNGFSTAEYAKVAGSVVGGDYIPAFVEDAKQTYLNKGNKNKLSFVVSDILNLDFKPESFDVVVSSRCLINLTSWEDQKRAISNIHKVLKKGGLFIFTEVTFQGMARLDALRKEFELSEIKKHWHNLYLDEVELEAFVKPMFEIQDVKRFGTYCLISKIVHPLYVAPEEPKYGAELNKIASLIGRKYVDFNGASHQVMYVLRKK